MKIGSVPGAARPAAPAQAPPKSGQQSGRSFVEVLRAADREVRARAPDAVAPRPVKVATGESPNKPAVAKPAPSTSVAAHVTRALDNITKGEARMDALLEAAAKGKTFSAGELIAMQATVFKYSQTVEVLSRATDKLVGALKQTLGTQV